MKTDILKLPFDQFSRQKLAFELIEALRTGKQNFSILDAGGYQGATHAFHPHDSVTVLDVFEVKEKDYIQGDATAMTFADNSFDFVVSFDVFEHIPRERREAFVSECARVARRGVIIAAPTGTPQNADAEVFLNNLFKQLHGHDHPWLKEHIDYRLPEPHLPQKLLEKNKLRTFAFSSNYLPAWMLMQGAIFAASKTDKVGKKIDALYKKYNASTYPDGVQELSRNYRMVTIGVKSDKDARVLSKLSAKYTANDDKKFENNLLVVKQVTQILVDALDEFFIESTNKTETIEKLQLQLEQLQDELADKQKSIAIMSTELEVIKQSRSYKLARKMAAAKNYPKRLLHKRKQV